MDPSLNKVGPVGQSWPAIRFNLTCQMFLVNKILQYLIFYEVKYVGSVGMVGGVALSGCSHAIKGFLVTFCIYNAIAASHIKFPFFES